MLSPVCVAVACSILPPVCVAVACSILTPICVAVACSMLPPVCVAVACSMLTSMGQHLEEGLDEAHVDPALLGLVPGGEAAPPGALVVHLVLQAAQPRLRSRGGATSPTMAGGHTQTPHLICPQTDRQADRQSERQAVRQTDRQTDRQAGRQTDRQADR